MAQRSCKQFARTSPCRQQQPQPSARPDIKPNKPGGEPLRAQFDTSHLPPLPKPRSSRSATARCRRGLPPRDSHEPTDQPLNLPQNDMAIRGMRDRSDLAIHAFRSYGPHQVERDARAHHLVSKNSCSRTAAARGPWTLISGHRQRPCRPVPLDLNICHARSTYSPRRPYTSHRVGVWPNGHPPTLAQPPQPFAAPHRHACPNHQPSLPALDLHTNSQPTAEPKPTHKHQLIIIKTDKKPDTQPNQQ